jgi:capsular polysaccharide transport system ATP-binding protein
MIRLDEVSKTYPSRSGPVTVLDRVSMHIAPGDHIGVLGRNGAGKSTLTRIIGGTEDPSSGSVTRRMKVSWPLAFGGAFQGSLTGLDNVRFICRVYDAPYADRLAFVEEFSELGRYMREPVKSYSSGMRARLAFAISMAVEFDCYLIDEVVAVGDARFQQKCMVELFQKRGDRAKIIVSHDAGYVREHCRRAVVLHEGRLYEFPTMDQSFEFYSQLIR